jgi:hypothetical protein
MMLRTQTLAPQPDTGSAAGTDRLPESEQEAERTRTDDIEKVTQIGTRG